MLTISVIYCTIFSALLKKREHQTTHIYNISVIEKGIRLCARRIYSCSHVVREDF